MIGKILKIQKNKYNKSPPRENNYYFDRVFFPIFSHFLLINMCEHIYECMYMQTSK